MSTLPNQDASVQAEETDVELPAPALKARSEKSPTAFRTISEVADELGVQQHVLRFWETKFNQVKPLKRGGGRRYYRPEDVALIRRIHDLLYTEGYTIKGVQKLLKEQGRSALVAGGEPAATVRPANNQGSAFTAAPARQPVADKAGLNDRQKAILEAMLGDLRDLRDYLKKSD